MPEMHVCAACKRLTEEIVPCPTCNSVFCAQPHKVGASRRDAFCKTYHLCSVRIARATVAGEVLMADRRRSRA